MMASPASVPGSPRKTHADVELQIQTDGTGLLAQVLDMDEDLHPAIFHSRIARAEGLAGLPREQGALGPALLQLLNEAITAQASSELKAEPESIVEAWIDSAARHGWGLRLRLRINPCPVGMRPSWRALRSAGVLIALPESPENEDRLEREIDEVVDWVLSMPWEAALDPLMSVSPAPRVSMVRSLPRLRGAPHVPETARDAASRAGALRVLLCWASPKAVADTWGQDSAPKIRARLEQERGWKCSVEVMAKTTIERLRLALCEGPRDILHILAHGSPDLLVEEDLSFVVTDGRLLLETEDGDPQGFSGQALAGLLGASGHPPPQLVFLQACDSGSVFGDVFRGIAQSLLSAGVDYVIAMQAPIRVDLAEEFAFRFYDCLGDWMSVDDAVREARVVLSRAQVPLDSSTNPLVDQLGPRGLAGVGATPVVYVRDGATGWLQHGPLPRAIVGPDKKIMLLIEPGDGASPYYIDKYPVTVAQYRASARGGDDLPATGMTFEEARKHAAAHGKSLPSHSQWLLALATTGNDPADNEHDRLAYNTMSYWLSRLEAPRRTPVTHFERELSPTVQDMLGNCEEFVLGPHGEEGRTGGSCYFNGRNAEWMKRFRSGLGNRSSAGFRMVLSLPEFRRLLLHDKLSLDITPTDRDPL